VPLRAADAFEREAAKAGVAVTAIGRMVRGKGVTVLGADGRPLRLARSSFDHFA
jgi:thiamine-monophosphate kinase